MPTVTELLETSLSLTDRPRTTRTTTNTSSRREIVVSPSDFATKFLVETPLGASRIPSMWGPWGTCGSESMRRRVFQHRGPTVRTQCNVPEGFSSPLGVWLLLSQHMHLCHEKSSPCGRSQRPTQHHVGDGALPSHVVNGEETRARCFLVTSPSRPPSVSTENALQRYPQYSNTDLRLSPLNNSIDSHARSAHRSSSDVITGRRRGSTVGFSLPKRRK